MKFVKNIFQCWLQGKENINKNIFKQNMHNWEILNNDWNYKLVDEGELRKACKLFSKECLNTFNSFDLLHLKVDFGRYVLIYIYGGVYVDMDMYILRNLSSSKDIQDLINISNTKHVLGLSSLNINHLESIFFCGRNKVINNAIMFSSPENPILKKLISSIISNKNIYKYNYERIQKTTGPLFINNFLGKYIDYNYKNYFIKVFPHYYFEPYTPYGLCDINDNTLTIHKMEMSWISNNIKFFIKLYYDFKNNIYIIFILIIIYILRKNKI